MKVASVIIKTASGWKSLCVDSDLVACRQLFKQIKVAGAHVVEGEVGEVAVYFDSAGRMMRKFLRSPEDRAAVNASTAEGLASMGKAEEAREFAVASSSDLADAKARASAVAARAVALIRDELAPGMGGEAGGGEAPTADDHARVVSELELTRERAAAQAQEIDTLKAQLAALGAAGRAPLSDLVHRGPVPAVLPIPNAASGASETVAPFSSAITEAAPLAPVPPTSASPASNDGEGGEGDEAAEHFGAKPRARRPKN